MAVTCSFSDDDLPTLKSILLPHSNVLTPQTRPLRRSPRKATTATTEQKDVQNPDEALLAVTSNQRQLKSSLPLQSRRSLHKPSSQTGTSNLPPHKGLPLPSKPAQILTPAPAQVLRPSDQNREFVQCDGTDSLLTQFSRLAVRRDGSDADALVVQSAKVKQNQTQKQQSACSTSVHAIRAPQVSRRVKSVQRSGRFILDEARCDEDLVDSEVEEDSEEEETDLSGFIVDDDVELSYNESSEEVESEEEQKTRRKAQREKPRRRLQRGRRQIEDSDDDTDGDNVTSTAPKDRQLGADCSKHAQNETAEVIDLTSPEPNNICRNDTLDSSGSNVTSLFDKLKALKLSPPRSSQTSDIPTKAQSTTWPTKQKGSKKIESDSENRHTAFSGSLLPKEDLSEDEARKKDRFNTPPVTPPRSPSKLKSPSKLLSPSKKGDTIQRSPHRQSMDAFWDLNEVNEWHDQFSPRKAPVMSPHKDRLAEFGVWSDAEEDSFEAINETSDSLPSPCESPTKSKSRYASPVKAEKQRLLAEKKTKQLEKKLFEESKNQMAVDLLQALDENVTCSRISKLSASTGGIRIIWSNTLRSTAGRANWRRTVTKPTGSPVKNRSEESAPGAIIQHFANIELATKVIDRPERLTNTLAHEFCHLANFMVSGIRDQPHGVSFQNWARKVTAWMKSQNEIPLWKSVQVTTKHSYVIEWKYLWVCVGRNQNKAMEYLNIEGEDGCGAEYGRHSKSIDTEKSRCGRCQGRLLQVRPKPRASPVKKARPERKVSVTRKSAERENDLGGLEKMVAIIELSD